MKDLTGFPCFEVEFNKRGEIHNRNQVQEMLDFLARGEISDLFVISHGWNNDMSEARDLYARFFACMHHVLSSGAVPGTSTRTFAIMAVLWPSKKFADKELVPSGAAGIESPVTNELLRQELKELKDVFDDPNANKVLEQAENLVENLEDSPKARKEFADLLRSILPKDDAADIDASDDFFNLPGDEIISRLSRPIPITMMRPSLRGGVAAIGGVAVDQSGSAAGIGQFFGGIKSGILNFLNFTSYYQMKARAGLVGSTGVNQVLRAIRNQNSNLKIHLIGHSFGGRLVTAAAAGSDGEPVIKVDTMTLLQAAFSHYGFAERYDEQNDGFFRKVIALRAVTGPILISHTENDTAVGKAYPLASLIAGQVASTLGDKNDKYGGIGRNGAQKTPEAHEGTLLPVDSIYQFEAGKIYNLNADRIITHHSDICHNEIAYAIFKAIADNH